MASEAKDAVGRRPNLWKRVVWGAAAFLLLLWVRQFTEEVNWGEADFIVFGAMLLAACGAYELATRRSINSAYRAACGLAVVAAFTLVWINLAVGIIGALIARFQPHGMAHEPLLPQQNLRSLLLEVRPAWCHRQPTAYQPP